MAGEYVFLFDGTFAGGYVFHFDGTLAGGCIFPLDGGYGLPFIGALAGGYVFFLLLLVGKLDNSKSTEVGDDEKGEAVCNRVSEAVADPGETTGAEAVGEAV